MTTPPTPAGWYPDPEQSEGLRYWDGAAWTEHQTPVQPQAPEPAEPDPAAVEPPATPRGGAHRAPDTEPEPAPAPEPSPMPLTEQPTTEVPLRPWSFEPPPLEPEATPGPLSGSEPTPEPAHESEPEPTHEPTPQPPPLPLTEQPTTKVPLRDWNAESQPEPAPYADATTSTPPVPAAVEPPAGTEPTAGPIDNRKLIMGFGGAVAGLLLVLILLAVYAFVIHEPDKTQLSSPTTTESSATSTQEPTSTPEESSQAEPPAPPPGAGATDGPLTFTVTGVESGTTVTDPTNDFLTKDAQGEFIVVHLTVQNTSPDPGQFLGTFQKLNAGGQVYNIDDEATFYVGGGFVDIPAGGQVDVGLAYDVPPGTAPESVELHADPTSPGAVLPVG